MARVLVADDDRHNARMLECILKEYGFEATIAANGVEALKLAREDPPDLIVSDILMPTMDGFALCKQVKSDKSLRHIPFVYYTAAYTGEKDRQFALSIGAEKFIVKPQNPATLVAELKKVLETHRPRGEGSPDTAGGEMEFFRQYNEVLFHKLENEMVELEQANQALEKEVQERKRAEGELQKTNSRFSEAQRIARIGSWEWNMETGEQLWSDETYRILGYSPGEIIPCFREFSGLVHPEDKPAFDRALDTVYEGQNAIGAECRLYRKDYGVIHVLLQGEAVFDGSGKPVSMIGTVLDITERKKTEEKIRAALAEKEILLKEIHHRVKNNLQLVASMLQLQAGYIEDGKARLLCEESQKRVEVMSLIHDQLYRSKDLARIDFKEYVDELCANLMALVPQASDRIRLQVDIEGVLLNVTRAIPCGLIINELVSNALRHAFPEDRTGSIDIRMRSGTGEEITLVVRDNGVGFPADIDYRNTHSLGMRLVVALAGQLDGVLDLDRTEGTSFTLRCGV